MEEHLYDFEEVKSSYKRHTHPQQHQILSKLKACLFLFYVPIEKIKCRALKGGGVACNSYIYLRRALFRVRKSFFSTNYLLRLQLSFLTNEKHTEEGRNTVRKREPERSTGLGKLFNIIIREMEKPQYDNIARPLEKLKIKIKTDKTKCC